MVNNKCFIMAKILQFVRMIWGFISIWFIKFRKYVGKEQKQSNELGDILNWQREEVTKLREVLKAEQVLNEKQCINLVEKLDQVVLYVNKMITCTKETTNDLGLVLGELHRITRKVRILVQDCGKQEWCNIVAFQINNREAFRELVYDLRCFWDAMCEKYLAIDPVSQFRIPCIDFSVATYDEIESDEKALVERLEKCLEMTPIGSTEYELEKYLLRRLRFKLAQVKGAELDALEIPMNIMEPVFVQEIGRGETGMVYETRWLGLKSATKISRSLSIFHKEACMLASLHHPNFVEVICCGRLHETHEENLDGSRHFFLVMELMDMSLSDLVKKQKMPLPYLVAIDMMHEIARGMCYLHDMHVAHLNLKPMNVLLKSVSRHVGVKGNIGFDFVKLSVSDTYKMEAQNKLVLEGCTIGTIQYMAPEMHDVNGKSISNMAFPFPADVWSFGMTCSEILSSKKPFSGIYTKRDILHKIQDRCRPKLPINCKELTMLIEECWIADPSQRPTFSDICKRLAILKRKFMVGVYSNVIPQFGKGGTFSQITTVAEFFNQMDISVSKKVRIHSITISLLCILRCSFFNCYNSFWC